MKPAAAIAMRLREAMAAPLAVASARLTRVGAGRVHRQVASRTPAGATHRACYAHSYNYSSVLAPSLPSSPRAAPPPAVPRAPCPLQPGSLVVVARVQPRAAGGRPDLPAPGRGGDGAEEGGRAGALAGGRGGGRGGGGAEAGVEAGVEAGGWRQAGGGGGRRVEAEACGWGRRQAGGRQGGWGGLPCSRVG